ncbi:proteasome maturation protein-like [Hippopotamus amphibius kiboko]|uniref:proteasome maturation protein-like n=1 Tax=Hippopotamus amphibius kiboko TaxID=575201 RepID=UPI002597535A|nr:proteasome maturation protein-like [Hippopotamus amphibius kiboko]
MGWLVRDLLQHLEGVNTRQFALQLPGPHSGPGRTFLPCHLFRAAACLPTLPTVPQVFRKFPTRIALRGCAQSKVKLNARGLESQLKDSIPVTELSASGPFEGHDLLQKGFSCVKNELLPSHPLELSEKNFQLNQDKMNFSTLRNIRGLFAPLKLQIEFKAVQQVQRLPFLPSSDLSLDILRCNDETVGFEDILNDPSQSKLMGEPHLMVDYKVGLL